MKTVGLITAAIAKKQPQEIKKVTDGLENCGLEIISDCREYGENYIENYDELFSKIDIAVVLGGDGTILSVAQYSARYNVPILGLNFGHLGYLAELNKEQTEDFARIINGEYETEERMMLDVKVVRDGEEIYSSTALNDAVATKGMLSKMVHMLLEIDGKYTGDYYSDGLIVSTPTGSTAYSLSAGGPIVEPKLNIILITPICAHSTNARPMVIADEQTVKVTVDIYHGEDVALMCDGKQPVMLRHGDEIYVTKSEYKTKLVRFQERNFFDILNKKLKGRGIKNV